VATGECINDELRAYVISDRPSNDKSGIGIHDRCAIQFPLSCRMLCNICQPQLVRRLDGEAALDQILLGCRSGRAAVASAPLEPLQTGLAHQSGDPLVVHRQPETKRQLGVHSRPAVCPARISVRFFNVFEQQRIRLVPRAGWTAQPVVVTRPRYTQNSTGHHDIDVSIGVFGEFADQSKR
jgi:hypothetical protein